MIEERSEQQVGQYRILETLRRPVYWLSAGRNQRYIYIFTLGMLLLNVAFSLLVQHVDMGALVVTDDPVAAKPPASTHTVLNTPTSVARATATPTISAPLPVTIPSPTSATASPTAPPPTATSVSLPDPTPTPAPLPVSILANGSFENGLNAWGFKYASPASATASATTSTNADGAYSAQVNILTASSSPWDVQLLQDTLPVTRGTTYTISFMAKASRAMPLDQIIQLSASPWSTYDEHDFSLTTSWQQYSYTFTAPASVNVLLTFNLAQTKGTIWLDAVSFSH